MKSKHPPQENAQPPAKLQAGDTRASIPHDPTDRFPAKQEVLHMLKMSPRTLQEWRNKRLIEFTRIGGKIFYSRNSIMRLLNERMQCFVIGGWVMARLIDEVCDWMNLVA